MSVFVEPSLPFRWDLISPDRFGTLLNGVGSPRLWFIEELVTCAGRVVARGGNGDLYFVGRSLDSMFDLLGGAFEATQWRDRLHRLPLSFALSGRRVGGRWQPGRISHAQAERFCRILDDLGLGPAALARRDRPVVFVDVVHGGSTFTLLYELLRAWIEREREAWKVIRRKVRFIGVTARARNCPQTFRWHQHADWTADMPARSVLNVSVDPRVWSYVADRQVKLTRTLRPESWLAEADGPQRDQHTPLALAEALAVVEYGRSVQARRALVRAMAGEPAIAEPWLRTLIVQLNVR